MFDTHTCLNKAICNPQKLSRILGHMHGSQEVGVELAEDHMRVYVQWTTPSSRFALPVCRQTTHLLRTNFLHFCVCLLSRYTQQTRDADVGNDELAFLQSDLSISAGEFDQLLVEEPTDFTICTKQLNAMVQVRKPAGSSGWMYQRIRRQGAWTH